MRGYECMDESHTTPDHRRSQFSASASPMRSTTAIHQEHKEACKQEIRGSFFIRFTEEGGDNALASSCGLGRSPPLITRAGGCELLRMPEYVEPPSKASATQRSSASQTSSRLFKPLCSRVWYTLACADAGAAGAYQSASRALIDRARASLTQQATAYSCSITSTAGSTHAPSRAPPVMSLGSAQVTAYTRDSNQSEFSTCLTGMKVREGPGL
eukprot:765438-Hanusia_phi.AAC.2